MGEIADDLFPSPPIEYTPNPQAARLLSRLIETGYYPERRPDWLRNEWLLAYQAVRKVAHTSRRERFQAFATATKSFPFEMVEAINDLSGQILDRTEQARYLYKTLDALHDPPILEWCVEKLFARPSLNLLVGDPGTKKTYLAIDLAVSVALGKPWLGHRVSTCPVLFVDEESGMYQLWGRLNSALHSHGADRGAPFYFVSLGGYDLRNSEDVEQLLSRAHSVDAGLIVIDALANLMRSSENNLASVQPVLFNLRRIADHCRAAVVVIHHNNRGGLFRGSSSISAAMDLMLSLESPPEDTLIHIRALKARFYAPKPFSARAVFTKDPEGKPLFRLEQVEAEPPPSQSQPTAAQQGLTLSILQFIASNQHATRQQLTRHISAHSQGSVRFAIQQLLSSGQIVRINSGSKGTQAVYGLPPNLSS
jgi:hypothetical protein